MEITKIEFECYSEAEQDKALALMDNLFAASYYIEANCINGNYWVITIEDISFIDLEAFIKAWKEQN